MSLRAVRNCQRQGWKLKLGLSSAPAPTNYSGIASKLLCNIARAKEGQGEKGYRPRSPEEFRKPRKRCVSPSLWISETHEVADRLGRLENKILLTELGETATGAQLFTVALCLFLLFPLLIQMEPVRSYWVFVLKSSGEGIHLSASCCFIYQTACAPNFSPDRKTSRHSKDNGGFTLAESFTRSFLG